MVPAGAPHCSSRRLHQLRPALADGSSPLFLRCLLAAHSSALRPSLLTLRSAVRGCSCHVLDSRSHVSALPRASPCLSSGLDAVSLHPTVAGRDLCIKVPGRIGAGWTSGGIDDPRTPAGHRVRCYHPRSVAPVEAESSRVQPIAFACRQAWALFHAAGIHDQPHPHCCHRASNSADAPPAIAESPPRICRAGRRPPRRPSNFAGRRCLYHRNDAERVRQDAARGRGPLSLGAHARQDT